MALVSEVAPRANKKYAVALPGPVRLPPSAVESPFSQVKTILLSYIWLMYDRSMYDSRILDPS